MSRPLDADTESGLALIPARTTQSTPCAAHELIPLEEKLRWEAALEGVPHAFAHTWENCHAMALSSALPTFLYHYKAGDLRVVCPLAERSYGGERDVLTPYGIAGMTSTGSAPGFAKAWRAFAAQAHISARRSRA